jgi:hypothetical protein
MFNNICKLIANAFRWMCIVLVVVVVIVVVIVVVSSSSTSRYTLIYIILFRFQLNHNQGNRSYNPLMMILLKPKHFGDCII